MPFAVFRRHQRKLLAITGILAMFGFVVADSLPRMLSGGQAGGDDPVVADLYGRPVHASDLAAMKTQRNNANLFMAELIALARQQRAPSFFGDLTTRSMVDALILQHEADRLGMPAGPEAGKDWLKLFFGPAMTSQIFEMILSRFNNSISGEQLLSDIANQVRLDSVRQLLGAPVVTPLDVFETYRDENERVSARAVGFRAEDYLS
jgi:peptidyl-prolyl cis-trans isomerase D